MCWRTRAATRHNESSQERKWAMTQYPRLGGINYNERVCKECWPKYDHPNSN